jgi:rRNA-processing protein FCF1
MSSSSAHPATGPHRRGLLIDSNLLLLLFVGQYDPTRIQKFKRTDQFTIRDYELLADYIEQFKEVVTTPSVLTEVSNLLGQLPENLRYYFWQHFARGLKNLHECYTPSQQLGDEKAFPKFGLTDMAILRAASGEYRVLTDDLRLTQYLLSENIDVINFNHLRSSD